MSSKFNVGDKVSFTLCVTTRHGFSIKSRDGKIVELYDDSAMVKYRGKNYTVPLCDLRPTNVASALTEAFMKGVSDE